MRKKVLIVLGILLLVSITMGISYASWVFSETQKDFNTLGSKCFEISMVNESESITINKAYPISDEEGLKEAGYTFTIKNTCNTYAAYEVNLEDMILSEKRLPSEYIKVSVDNGRPISLKEIEKQAGNIEGSDSSYKLTSGSLAPEEETTYNIKMWMDEETPAIEEVMNASFVSKVSISAGYIKEEEIANELSLKVESKTPNINNEAEEFTIEGISVKHNIIEYSLDNKTWNRIEEKGKEVNFNITITKEGTYTIYIKDEMGNVESQEFTTNKLDQTAPNIIINEQNKQESIELTIEITDKNNIDYAITEKKEEPSEWNKYENKITYEISENKTYYIWAKDAGGNVSYKEYVASTIDKEAPSLEINNALTEWGEKDYITIKASDDVIGITGYSISKIEGEYNWIEVDNTLKYETKIELTENGTYYVSIKDAYNHITTKSIVIEKIDNLAPSISMEITQESGIVNINVNAIDNESGINEYYYKADENDWIIIKNNTYQFTDLSNGLHKISVKVTDNNQNESEVLEKEVNVYRNYDVSIFLANGTIAESISLNNLISNGSLEAEGAHWTTSANFTTITNSLQGSLVTSDVLYGSKAIYIDDTSTTQGYWNYQHLDPKPNINDQLYGAGYLKSNGQESGDILFTYQDEEQNKIDFGHTSIINNEYEKVSNYEKAPSSTTLFQFGSLSTGVHTTYYDGFYVLNLTKDFGADNVPTKEWVDERTDYFDNIASIKTAKIRSDESKNYSYSLESGYEISTYTCSNATLKIENNTIALSEIKGDVICKIQSTDTSNPTVNFGINSSTSGSNGWYKALSIKATTSDSGSGIASAKYCVTTGNSCTPGTNLGLSNNVGTITLGTNANAQRVCVSAIDNAGNTTTSCSGTYKVDDSKPTISLGVNSSTSGSNGWYKALSIKATISESGSGINNAKYCVTTGSSCTPGTNLSLSNNVGTITLGTNANAQRICVSATDNAGNTTSSCSGTYKVDTANPTAKISATVKQNNITVSASGSSDSGSGIKNYQYRLDNGQWYSSTSTSYTFSNVSVGSHTVYVQVVDNAGRTSSAVSANKSIASDNIIYEGGAKYDYLKQVHTNASRGTINVGSSYIYFNAYEYKSLVFNYSFPNNYRYLKVTARALKTSTYGTYYDAWFGTKNSSTINDGGLPDASLIYRIISVTTGALTNYNEYTTFTLDLNSLSSNFYVFLYNCDTSFYIQKVWLTNTA